MCWYPSDYGKFKEIRHLPFIGRPVGGLSRRDMHQIIHLHGFEEFALFGRDKAGSPMTVLCIVITSRSKALPKGGVESQELNSLHGMPGGTVDSSDCEGAVQLSIATLVACRCSWP
jgi:hypothetical protein